MNNSARNASAKPTKRMDPQRLEGLIQQALETELGGVEVYRTALRCARNEELRHEWKTYLAQTEEHVDRVRTLCEELGIDADSDTPGRQVVRHIGEALVEAMEMALESDPDGAEIVAAECVTLAETKDHLNWELIGELAKTADADRKEAFADAHDETEEEENEHLYHSQGWARELWLESLGLPAVLPPPEEVHDVKTAIGAAKAKQARTKDMKKSKPSSSKRSPSKKKDDADAETEA